jgi:hypothetical protein
MENEDAFATEAQDEARVSRRRSQRRSDLEISTARISSPTRDNHSEDEGSPLLPSKSATARTTGAEEDQESYQRAINEPWLGTRGSEELPWHRKPSVSAELLKRPSASMLTTTDSIPSTCLLSLLPCLRRPYCSKDLSRTRPDMPGLSVRPSSSGPDFQILARRIWLRKSTVPRPTCTVIGC